MPRQGSRVGDTVGVRVGNAVKLAVGLAAAVVPRHAAGTAVTCFVAAACHACPGMARAAPRQSQIMYAELGIRSSSPSGTRLYFARVI